MSRHVRVVRGQPVGNWQAAKLRNLPKKDNQRQSYTTDFGTLFWVEGQGEAWANFRERSCNWRRRTPTHSRSHSSEEGGGCGRTSIKNGFCVGFLCSQLDTTQTVSKKSQRRWRENSLFIYRYSLNTTGWVNGMLLSHPSGMEGRIALELAVEAPEYDEDEQLTKIPLESHPHAFLQVSE